MDWPFTVGAFGAGYVVGWLVAVVRRRRGRISVTVVADGRDPPTNRTPRDR